MPANKPSVISGFRNNLKTILFLKGILLIYYLLLFTDVLHFSDNRKNGACTIMIASLDITILFIIIIVAILGTFKKKLAFMIFFI